MNLINANVDRANMNCLITGGAGFIGSHLADALLQKNHKVIVVDNFYSGKKENLHENVLFCHRSVTDDLTDVFKKFEVDCVFHFAALPGVVQSKDGPLESNRVNVSASVSLLETCRKRDARFVFSSSAAVYDNVDVAAEDSASQRPASLYGFQKMIIEEYASRFFELYGLPTVVLRYFNVYGPRQVSAQANAAVIPSFINAVIRSQPLTIYGDGNQTRDFVYVKDVTKANFLAMKVKTYGRPINVGSGISHSILDVATCINQLSTQPVKIKHESSQSGLMHSRADIRRAEELLGWTPETKFTEGLRETYSYYDSKKTS